MLLNIPERNDPSCIKFCSKLTTLLPSCLVMSNGLFVGWKQVTISSNLRGEGDVCLERCYSQDSILQYECSRSFIVTDLFSHVSTENIKYSVNVVSLTIS